MTGKLYGKANSFRTQKVLIAAKIANADVTLAGEDLPHDKFPLGVTPAYDDGNVQLFGAEAIAVHLAGQALKPANCTEVVQWLQWAEGHLLPNVLGYVLPSVSAVHINEKEVESARIELLEQLGLLNKILLKKTFLVGERMSLADISVAMDLLPAYQYVLDEPTRAPLANLNRWFKTIVNQPVVLDVLGEVKFAPESAKFDPSKFKEYSSKAHKAEPAAKKEKEGKKGKGKQNKAAQSKETEEDEDDIDDVHAQEPKSADPFAGMPKGTFDMDSFKRVYSNEDTATVAIPYLWENFDPAHYSIWFADYKYPEELTLTFMSCNLIGGMYQRLEKLKKNAFASVCLFGTDNNSTISGVWIWRGHELVFPLSRDWQIDYESYDWKKLDPEDEKTRKIVNEYLMWEGDFDGKKFNQGKIFK